MPIIDQIVNVSSGTFSIPTEKDGTLLLANVRAQLPSVCGLWFWSHDFQVKRAVRYDQHTNKLFAPDQTGWGDRTYGASFSTFLAPGLQEKELERYQVASRMLQHSIESMTRINCTAPAQSKVKVAYLKKRSTSSHNEIRKSGQASILLEESEKNSAVVESKIDQNSVGIVELQKLHEQSLLDINVKKLEIKSSERDLENTKKDFELLVAPSEGFGNARFAQDIASLKKQLDGTKRKCCEVEGALQAKSRECVALHDWKLEAEHTIGRLETEHSSCSSRREKLEATVHALHQFALIMQREAETAKKKAGIDLGHRLFISDDRLSIQLEEKIERLQRDLDVALDNLHRKSEESDDLRWRCAELESEMDARAQKAVHRGANLQSKVANAAALQLKLKQMNDADDEVGILQVTRINLDEQRWQEPGGESTSGNDYSLITDDLTSFGTLVDESGIRIDEHIGKT